LPAAGFRHPPRHVCGVGHSREREPGVAGNRETCLRYDQSSASLLRDGYKKTTYLQYLISYSIVCEFSLNTVSLILNLYFLSSTLSLTYCFESSLKITLQDLYNTYFLLLSFSKRWTILLSTKYDRVNTINPLSTFS